MNKRTETEILWRLKDTEIAMEPENLACDGELSNSAAKKKYFKLKQERTALIRELGREPKFEEIWGTK